MNRRAHQAVMFTQRDQHDPMDPGGSCRMTDRMQGWCCSYHRGFDAGGWAVLAEFRKQGIIPQPCERCSGRGSIFNPEPDHPISELHVACPDCDGTGDQENPGPTVRMDTVTAIDADAAERLLKRVGAAMRQKGTA